MGSPPSGTVTFLFTDVEGSTRLWEERPDEMRSALAEHDGIVRGAIEAHGGYVFATGGDGFAAAFSRAADGVDAAVKAQAGLADHPLIRVRMGLHTGEVQERDGDYFGPAVNRAARIMAAGHGGQVLLSAATEALLDDSVVRRDLGEHRLRDLSAPQRVFQLGTESFAPLRSLDVVPSNLPAERSVFVGREQELATVAGLVRSARVVTLTGVGGIGKTRLAIQVAAGLVDEFSAGVWLVELAPLIDAALVAGAVASAVGAPPSPGVEPTDVVCRFLAHKRALVVLDNWEHVIDAAAALVDRLADAAPRTKVLATSREPLSVRGESVWRVPSLSVEDTDNSGDAVALFAERAGQARSGFAIDDTNRDAVARVCRRLDGIPLAIELAAARARVMSVEQIAARLDERFKLLTRGGRTAVPRQQTLQGAIDWSYDLLVAEERELFDRLAVFAGDFDVVAAAAVGGVGEFEALDLIGQLVDKSMVEADPAKDRYRLLETLRQYGWDRLASGGRLAGARDAHAAHYATVASDAVTLMRTAGHQADAVDRLDAEYDNLRAALAHLIDSAQADTAARMVQRLVGLFNIRHPAEGLGWFTAVIAISDELPPRARARLLGDASHAALGAGDLHALFAYAQQALEIGGPEAPAIAYIQLAHWHIWNNEPQRVLELGHQALAAEDPVTQIMARGDVVMALGALGAAGETRAQMAEQVKQAQALADPVFLASTYSNGGWALAMLGHTEEAIEHLEIAFRYADAAGAAMANVLMSSLALELDDPDRAAELLRIAIPMARNQLGGLSQAAPMVASAKLASHSGRPREAAQLLGAVECCREQAGVRGHFYWQRWIERIVQQLTATLGADTVAHELAAGHRLSADEAFKLALACLAPAP